jgi:hypothetical protein
VRGIGGPLSLVHNEGATKASRGHRILRDPVHSRAFKPVNANAYGESHGCSWLHHRNEWSGLQLAKDPLDDRSNE